MGEDYGAPPGNENITSDTPAAYPLETEFPSRESMVTVLNPGTNSGTLTFDTPITGQFALSLKAANAFSLFYYNTNVPVTDIAFDTLGVSVNQNGIAQGLSHATLYAVPVPEADTYALMLAGLGLLGLGVARRRQR